MNIINWLSERVFGKGKPLCELSEELKSYFLTGVDRWKSVYEGGGDWRYARKGGLEGGYRRVRSLGAAKALCAEFSALCFSQQMDIVCSDAETKAFLENALQENGFWSCFPLFLEKMFAVGSGVVKVYCEGGKILLDYIGGDGFIPTQYDEKRVYGGIIISSVSSGNDRYVLLERHEKTKTGYVVTNTLLKRRGDGSFTEVPLAELYPELEPETTVNGLSEPLFVYFRPAVAGAGDSALGVSVFAASVDTLESLDVVFDSLQREFILGKKRIIVPVSAIRGEYGSDGKLHKYFNEQDEVYEAFSADDREELKITDCGTELRVNEHAAALEQLLDLLCMQTGLSAGSLSWHSDTAKTATEVISRNDKTYRTKTAHQQLLRESLLLLLENIRLLAVLCGELPATAVGSEIGVVFADSVTYDNSAKIDNALKLYNAGLIDGNRAMSEIYGITAQEQEMNI